MSQQHHPILGELSRDEAAIISVYRSTGVGFHPVLRAMTEPGPKPAEATQEQRTAADFDRTHAEARPLAIELMRHVVANWRTAKALSETAYKRYDEFDDKTVSDADDESREWDRILDAAREIYTDAEAQVCSVVLLITGRVKRLFKVNEMDYGWAPVAFGLGPETFVVSPTDEDDPVPRLVVVGPGGHDDSTWGRPDW